MQSSRKAWPPCQLLYPESLVIHFIHSERWVRAFSFASALYLPSVTSKIWVKCWSKIASLGLSLLEQDGS